MRKLIQTEGNWYKGNLHMHTKRSDGHLNIKDAIEIYHKNGYDFVAVTDHRKPSVTIEPHQIGVIDNQEIKMEEMLLLSGVEWDTHGRNSKLPDDVPCFHILGIGMTQNEVGKDFDQVLRPTPQQMIDTIKSDGGYVVLAHPCWSIMDPHTILDCKGVDATEIYNAVSDIPWNGQRSDSSAWFDIWATHYDINMPAVAGDDVHQYEGDECRSFTMVNATSLTSKDIMEALRNGNFYASQGPKIKELTVDEERKTVHVECSKDVVMAVFYGNNIWTKDRFSLVHNGKVDYEYNEATNYIRVELITTDGRKAWTSPYKVM